MSKRVNINEHSIILIHKSLIVIGIMMIVAGLAADVLGVGTKGFGFGPGQIAALFVGLSIIASSVILRLKKPLKRSLYSIVLAVILALLWGFWLYPASHYGLNPFCQIPLTERVLILSHLFILSLSLLSAGIAALGVLRSPLKTANTPKTAKMLWDTTTTNDIAMRSANQKAVVAFAILITALMACYCFFTYPTEEVDDLGLYNPVYTYLTYGKMTYPAYYYFDAMFAHPPVRYLLIAWLMKLGFNSFYAMTIPIFGLFLFGVSLIVKSRFHSHEKIALLFGMFAPLGLFFGRSVAEGPVEVMGPYGPVIFDSLQSISSIRPDVTLALGWFAGLVALESARIEGWNERKLVLGSLLLVFASSLHYYGWIAWLGIAVYIIYMFRDLDPKIGLRKTVIILISICCFWLPYLVLFALPQLNNILNLSRLVQGNGGIWDSINLHIGQYIYNQHVFPDDYSPYILIFLRPVWFLRIPLALFAWVFLIIPKNTRGLALSSLFLTLFVCLNSQGKTSGYYIPEMMIYLSGIVLVLFLVIQAGISKIFPLGVTKYTLSLVTLCLIVACIKGNFYLKRVNISLKPYRHEMHLARACAKDIIGPGAVIAGRLELWYAGGAEYWYDISPDLLWKTDISHIDLSTYFSRFDAIVEQHHFANITSNNQHATLSSWYADGTLHLRGCYLTNNGPGLNFLILSGKENDMKNLFGYGLYKPDILFRFDQDMHGDYIFVSLVGPTSGNYSKLKTCSLFYNGIPLPSQNSSNESLVGIQKIKNHVYTFFLPQNAYEELKSHLDRSIMIRDEILCRMVPVDPEFLLQNLKLDHPIQFYHSLEELSENISK